MTVIRQAIGDYLAVRRALGYKLEDHDWLLADFASFVEAAGAGTVTTSLALDWATQPENVLPSWHAARLRVVRGFARHLQALDPATEVPPAGLLASRNRRAVPYLYSDAEVKALMAATGSLRPALHAATHKTLIGLLAVTGMRLGEVIRLDCADLNTAEGIVTIRDSKFAKSRQVPARLDDRPDPRYGRRPASGTRRTPRRATRDRPARRRLRNPRPARPRSLKT
jgi:integrase/recombinase XerD